MRACAKLAGAMQSIFRSYMLQFIRYAALIEKTRAQQGTVIVECPRFLIPLFSTCRGIDRLVAEGDSLPEFDVQAPLMGLPRLFKTTLESLPATVPYLFPDAGPLQSPIPIVIIGLARGRHGQIRMFEKRSSLIGFRISCFEFVSDFEIRISSFSFRGY